MDTLYRDDLRPCAPARPKMVKRMRWVVLRGALQDAGTYASRRLYTAAQARRFVKLAKHFGLDVYAARFGLVCVPKENVSSTAVPEHPSVAEEPARCSSCGVPAPTAIVDMDGWGCDATRALACPRCLLQPDRENV